MRLVAAAALLAALASVPSAQTQFADSSGAYVGVHRLSDAYGTGFGLGAQVGRRLSNGFDYGVQFDVNQSSRTGRLPGTFSSFAIGPTLGYTRSVGAGVLGRVSTAVLYGSSGATSQAIIGTERGQYGSLSGQYLTGSIAATVSRPVRVYGSLRVQPTVGVLADVSRSLSFETDVAGLDQSGTRSRGGVLLQLPVSLRVLDSDVTFAPSVVVLDGVRGGYGYAGGGLRVNF